MYRGRCLWRHTRLNINNNLNFFHLFRSKKKWNPSVCSSSSGCCMAHGLWNPSTCSLAFWSCLFLYRGVCSVPKERETSWRQAAAVPATLATFFPLKCTLKKSIPFGNKALVNYVLLYKSRNSIITKRKSFRHEIGDEWPPDVTIFLFFSIYRVTSPGHQGYLGATVVSTGLSDWQALGIELCLTFVITLVYLVGFFSLYLGIIYYNWTAPFFWNF